jgi:hypothetical protein
MFYRCRIGSSNRDLCSSEVAQNPPSRIAERSNRWWYRRVHRLSVTDRPGYGNQRTLFPMETARSSVSCLSRVKRESLSKSASSRERSNSSAKKTLGRMEVMGSRVKTDASLALLIRQIRILCITWGVSFVAFLVMLLPSMLSFFTLMLSGLIVALLSHALYQYITAFAQFQVAVILDRGIISYPPDAFRDYFTTTSIDEFLRLFTSRQNSVALSSRC